MVGSDGLSPGHTSRSRMGKRADDPIDLVARAQQPDGGLNSYYTIVEPENRWTNLADNRTVLCGTFIEAAVAYYANGKDRLMPCKLRIISIQSSVRNPTNCRAIRHEEIELALVRLYGVTQIRSIPA